MSHSPDDPLRAEALRRLERRRGLWMHAAAYVMTSLVLIAVWAVTEYSNSGGWPERFSSDGQPGNWNPWILYALLGGAVLTAVRAWLRYGPRPFSEAEMRAEMERLRAGGQA